MILNKLHAGSEVCLVEFVRNVPAQGAEFASLLDKTRVICTSS